MKKATMFLIASGLLALLFVVIYWLKPNSADDATNQNTASALSQIQPADNQSQDIDITEPPKVHIKFVTGLEGLPRSLQGTQVDGEIIIDENKQLVVTRGLRRLFDYFLSTLGEESAETIHQRVVAYIKHHTPEPAASQAIEIYHNYVAYLQALKTIEADYGSLQMSATLEGKLDINLLRQRQQQVAKLRQQYFKQATIEAFFTEDDSYEDYSLAMWQINDNDSLSEAEKQAAKQDYISRLPDNSTNQQLRDYEQQKVNFANLLTRTQQMKQAGATAEELYAMRVELVGEDAAKRLAVVDAEDADFEQRFVQYQTQKQAIVEQYGNSEQASSQLTKLEQSLFSEAEAKRLDGYAQFRQQ